MIYFAAQKFLTAENIGHVVPTELVGWLPMICGVVAFFAMQKYNKAKAAKATSGIIGTEAPDFELKFHDKVTTLKDLVKKTAKPTVIDFYQNF